MQINVQMKKVMKVLILAFLCTEMQSTYTQSNVQQQKALEHEVHGLITSENAPYQASIRLLAGEQEHFGKGHICSGALVAPSVVLTVAHCLYSERRQTVYHPSELRVMLGSSQRFAPTEQALIYGVTHVYHMPELAILMLQHDVPPKQPHVEPVALSGFNTLTTLSDAGVGPNWYVITWGINISGRELHDLVRIPVVMKSCQEEEPQQDLICCGIEDYERPTVTADVGAPLMKDNHLLVGLRSSTGKYVNVTKHVDWIHQQIGDGSNQNSSIWGILGFLAFTVYVVKISSKSRSI